MDVFFESRDAVRGLLKIVIEPDDYAENVDAEMRRTRAQAGIRGFRRGAAPMGVIYNLYSRKAILDEVQHLLSNGLANFLRDNDIKILAEPLARDLTMDRNDMLHAKTFEFYYDLAFAPALAHGLSKDDHLPYFMVDVDKATVDRQIAIFCNIFAETGQDVGEVMAGDLVKGSMTELEDGWPKDGGLFVDDVLLVPAFIKNEEERQPFIGLAKGDMITFNPFKGYEGDAGEIASLLRVDPLKAEAITCDFSFTVTSITRQKNAEIGQELFDKVFGEGVVTDEEAFRAETAAMLSARYDYRSDAKFYIDAYPLMMSKLEDVTLADDLLKGWMLTKERYRTMEEADAGYPGVLEGTKFILLKEAILGEGEEIGESEVEDAARSMVREQFASHGIFNLEDDVLNNYVQNMLSDKDSLKYAVDRVTERKIVAWLKDTITTDIIHVSPEAFEKLLTSPSEGQS
jgi:trigger factor